MPIELTPDESAAARRAGIAVFADRLILEARDPIDAATLARVQELCRGPLPDDLLTLWSTSFGGKLDYDVPVRFGDHVASFSLRELFYPESDHYRDLFGWIDAQLEVEEEAGEESDAVGLLPIGGFEYLDRLYVQVEPGPHHGAVYLWMRGLPPAWRLRLHEDSSARVAPNLRAFFAQLVLEDDPWSPDGEYPSGTDMVEAIASLRDAAPSAAAKLEQGVRAAILDWRATVDDGSVVEHDAARRLALDSVARHDDVALLDRLLALGCDPNERYRGGGAVVDHALARGSKGVVRRLLDLDVDVTNGLRNVGDLDRALAEELLRRGAEVDTRAVRSIAGRDGELGVFLADVLFERDPDAARALVKGAREDAKRNEATAARVESGAMGSNRTPAEYRALVARMRALADHLAAKG